MAMISRRALLAGLGLSALVGPAKASSGTIFGAWRWDAYYGLTSRSAYVENILGPSYWQYRAPWFTKITGTNTISLSTAGGATQANLDLELQAAHAAGVQYWAYDAYFTTSGQPCDSDYTCTFNFGFMQAWKLHQSSAYSALVKWAWNYQDPGSASAMAAQIANVASYMGASNYLTVLGGRPVFYFLTSTTSTTYAAQITALRTAVMALGKPNPYVVAVNLQSSASTVVATALAIGADAISNYSYFTVSNFAQMTSVLGGNWTAFAAAATAAGLGFVPNCCLGADRRAQFESVSGVPWANHMYFVPPGTNAERVAQVQAAITFTLANAAVCSSTLIVAYAWDELTEGGGGLIPTLGDPPASTPPYMNGIETALSAILP